MLYIEDVTDLTIPEIQCILACRTNNPSLNSFAAEIVFHATWAINANNNSDRNVLLYYAYPLLIVCDEIESSVLDYIYEKAISADISAGDIGIFRELLVDGPAYKLDGLFYYQEQVEIWGER